MRKARLLTLTALLCQTAPLYAQDDCGYVTKPGYPLAATEDDLDLFDRSISGNDTALFLHLRQEGRASMSVAGVEVCVVKRKDTDKIKIRPKGATLELWTLPEAVQKQGAE